MSNKVFKVGDIVIGLEVDHDAYFQYIMRKCEIVSVNGTTGKKQNPIYGVRVLSGNFPNNIERTAVQHIGNEFYVAGGEIHLFETKELLFEFADKVKKIELQDARFELETAQKKIDELEKMDIEKLFNDLLS